MEAFFHSRHLGTLPVPSQASWALFCPGCGEVWGRLVGAEKRWSLLVRGCEKHPTGGGYGGGSGPVPGSFLFALSWAHGPLWEMVLVHMGAALRRHEVEMLLRRAGV